MLSTVGGEMNELYALDRGALGVGKNADKKIDGRGIFSPRGRFALHVDSTHQQNPT